MRRRGNGGPIDDAIRDKLLARPRRFRERIAVVDARLEGLRAEPPQVEALLDLRGIGLDSGPVAVTEPGEIPRLRSVR